MENQTNTPETIQYLRGADGEPIGVFVPIALWRDKEAERFAATNGNGAEPHQNGTHPHGNTIIATVSKTRRQKPLTPEQERQKEEYDRIFAIVDNRLDPVMAEIQARSLHFEDEW